MKSKIILAAIVAVYALPAAAKTKPPVFVEAAAVKDGKDVKLDPAKAYVMLRMPGAQPMHFTRIADADEKVVYDKLKADAFVEAREDYVKKEAKYKRDLADSIKLKTSKPKPVIEPTEANFQFPSFGQMANFTTGPLMRFSKKDGSTFLHSVTPGKYRLYGQVDPLMGLGVCYCMGSVTFEAEAGKIADLGTMAADPANMGEAEKGDSSSPRTFAYALALIPADGSTPVDPRIASFPRMAANFQAAGKVTNYMGIAVSRLPAIRGVMSYNRDKIVDEKAVAVAPVAVAVAPAAVAEPAIVTTAN
jgi:hypothetical protein